MIRVSLLSCSLKCFLHFVTYRGSRMRVFRNTKSCHGHEFLVSNSRPETDQIRTKRPISMTLGPMAPGKQKKRSRTRCLHDLLIQILSKIDFVSLLPQLFSKQSWLLAGLTSPKPCLINSFAKPGLPSVLISHSRMFKFLAFTLQSKLAHLCKRMAFPRPFCYFLIPSPQCFDCN